MKKVYLFLMVSLAVLSACTSEQKTIQSSNIVEPVTCPEPSNFYKTEYDSCQNVNLQLIEDRDYWKEKFQNLADSVNFMEAEKSEYRIALQSCYEADKTYETSGILISRMCPTCDYESSCDSGSMMPAFGCKSDIELHKVFNPSDIQVCDVIAFNRPSGIPLFHRVWKVYKDEEGVTRYKTAGDNSQQFDDYDPRFSDLIGAVGKVVNT